MNSFGGFDFDGSSLLLLRRERDIRWGNDLAVKIDKKRMRE